MSSKEVDDFLTKQIFIERNIVTYRSLSRQLSLHVNVAKNELATFHAKATSQGQTPIAATYLLSGEADVSSPQVDDDMDVDMDAEYEGDAEEVAETTVVLVGEQDLARVKASFRTLNTIHVYSLSPSPIKDAGLLCGPTDIVRDIDSKKGTEMASIVGKVVGMNIKEGKGKYLPPPPPPPAAGPSTSKRSVNAYEKVSEDRGNGANKEKEKEKASAITEKPKPTGKLDFFKPKPKVEKGSTKKGKEQEVPKMEKEQESAKKGKEKDTKDTKTEKRQVSVRKDDTEESADGKEKRASTKDLAKKVKEVSIKAEDSESAPKVSKTSRKRKSEAALLSDSEEESETQTSRKPSPKNKSQVRVKKGAIISDDEDEEEVPAATRSKGKAKLKPTSDDEDEDLKAMMDVDDDQVIRATRPTRQPVEEETQEGPSEPETQNEDIEMADEIAPVPKKKRKAKKVVPVGSNGLKKKRVSKSRVTQDDKGYMVTEDYSSYESVDEEEEEPEPVKSKGKGKGKGRASEVKKAEADSKVVEESDSGVDSAAKTKSSVKARSASAKGKGNSGGQKGISAFFGKQKNK